MATKQQTGIVIQPPAIMLRFEVQSKLKGRQKSLKALHARDSHSRGRLLSAVDISRDGDGSPHSSDG
ncbi:hypothetical protein CRG98_027966 [Punica granatum]|uniref:Uncharacterized protein n=1 Tax=Punica granatum TaxID=22663 RepID=A0A2I0J613_PUNGR|nr:hypothetical protein CRG98_027966 [Punica granatum]